MQSKSVTKFFRRFLSKKSRISLPYSDKVIVLHSQYNDPYLNLAYENWIYENVDLECQDVLYFWQNSPCVVIGRHQNPWLECDLQYLQQHGIKLARRYSGGGTVYHDLGNLNITFMTSRSKYHRRHNLECIAKALSSTWNLDIELSPRDDLVIDGIFKISGSAAKLGRYASYHHCTLLCNAHLDHLRKAIKPRIIANSRATRSVTSHVINLKDIEPSLNVKAVIRSVAQTYLQDRQSNILCMDIFQEHLDEICKMKGDLSTWEWVYGKTSPFTVSKTTLLQSGIHAKVNIEICSGHIDSVTILPSFEFEHKINNLKGVRFDSEDISNAVTSCLEVLTASQDNTMENHFREILTTISNII